MFHADPGDPGSRRLGVGEIAGRVPRRAMQLLAVLGTRLDATVKGARHDPLADVDADAAGAGAPGRSAAEPAGPLDIALGLLLVLALGREAWRGRGAAEWFALGAIALLLVYFGFQDRLALPIFAISLIAALAWLRDVAVAWIGEPRGTRLAVAAAVAVAVLDFAPRAGWSQLEADHRRMAAESDSVRPLLAPDERVAAWRGFHHGVFLERPVYSLHRAVGRLGAAAGIASVVDRYALDAVFLTTGGLAHVRHHLEARYGPPIRNGPAELWKTGR
jgi:hypothetical protein